MHIPITYTADRAVAEKMLLDAAAKETLSITEAAQPALEALQKRFLIEAADLRPRVFVRLTDNWVELSVRFICKDHDIRGLKDRMSRNIINNLDSAGIGIAPSTYDVVCMPPLRMQTNP